IANRPPQRKQATPSMSTPVLFIPTYGQPSKEQETSGRSKNSRELPSKCTAPSHASGSSKRSLMPSLVFNGNIEYVQSFEVAEKAARALEAARPKVLGFDIEWQVSFVAGEAPRPTATLQLCVPDHPNGTIQETTAQTQNNPNPASTSGASSDNLQQQQSCSVWGTAFIFHLCTMRGHPSTIRGRPSTPSSSLASSSLPGGTLAKGADIGVEHADEDSKGQKRHHRNPTAAAYLPDSLVRVLLNPDILLVGVGVGGDVSRLEREYEQLRASGVRGVVDLSEVAKRKVVPERRRRGMWSLADLCAEVLQLELRKPSSLRTGSWERCPLSVDQLFYAAADAYAGLRLWQVMHGMPDLAMRRSEANARQRENTGNDGGCITAAAGARNGGNCEMQGYGRPTVGGKAAGAVDAENQAPTSSSVRQRLAQSKLETHRLWHQDGLSVDAVAEIRCNKASTVRGYLSDCIEAGLPYDWTRVGIDSKKEEEIVGALLAAKRNHKPPTAAGHDSTVAPAGSGGDKKADVPECTSGGHGIPAAAADASTASSGGAFGNAADAVGSCSGGATTGGGATLGHGREGGRGDRSSSSNDRSTKCHTGSSVGLACSDDANGGSVARGKATG
ncbi:unnamed protein product, partial [Pylaiella littoralis]